VHPWDHADELCDGGEAGLGACHWQRGEVDAGREMGWRFQVPACLSTRGQRRLDESITGGRFILILLTGRITKWVRPGMTHLASLPDKGSPASSLFKDDFSLMVSESVGQVSPVRVASAGSLEIGRLAAGATFRRSHAADNVPRRLGCRASQAFTQYHRDVLQRSEDLSASQSRRRSHLTAFQDVSLGGPLRPSAIGTWLHSRTFSYESLMVI
jgi:hypothetical protein